ncbi:NADAR family protein [Solwaraspora sp. WMMA2101]|uniref:NADAR family protein n=1 Tax=Solwaraspora sp. WMMA2101 TaxID=3404124 RepID=UPI003B92C02E
MLAQVRDVADRMAAGHRVRFLFFWGHQPAADGSVGAECLSQWSPHSFAVDGVAFATAEHYMMWRKAVLFDDRAMAQRILVAPHPRAATVLGGRVAGFDQRSWNAHRVPIVVAGNLAKFSQHPDLRAYLLATGERVLVEASPMDRIWGIGLTRDDPAAVDPTRWRGLNLLGFALMQVRETLRERAGG